MADTREEENTRVRVNLWMDRALVDRLRTEAEILGTTMTDIIRLLATDFVDGKVEVTRTLRASGTTPTRPELKKKKKSTEEVIA